MLNIQLFILNLTMKRLIYILIIPLLFFNCSENKAHPKDFYYWRSNFNINAKEKNVVQELDVQNLYIRFFDVDKSQSVPQPVGMIKQFNSKVIDVNYIPTVFITNRTFAGISPNEVKHLAKNVHQLIFDIAKAGNLSSFNEIQIDCDWTKSTRNNYFLFLEELKEISQKQVSATLRLHQVKFKEREGIPPLDKMVLMCYATENPTEVEDKNSILDLNLAKDYLQNVDDYPIQLDVALPLYSWAIVTNPIGKVKLLNSFNVEELNGKPVVDKGNGKYEVTEDFFLRNFYLSKGFKIKIEAINQELLMQTKSFLDSKLKDDYRIIYYHLDEKFIQHYNLNQL